MSGFDFVRRVREGTESRHIPIILLTARREPDDIAWAAVYLASDEAKFVTGQVLSPNGGWYMSQ